MIHAFILDALWGSFLQELTARVREDLIWCRVCERLTTGLPDKCLDKVLGTLLRLLPWSVHISIMFSR